MGDGREHLTTSLRLPVLKWSDAAATRHSQTDKGDNSDAEAPCPGRLARAQRGLGNPNRIVERGRPRIHGMARRRVLSLALGTAWGGIEGCALADMGGSVDLAAIPHADQVGARVSTAAAFDARRQDHRTSLPPIRMGARLAEVAPGGRHAAERQCETGRATACQGQRTRLRDHRRMPPGSHCCLEGGQRDLADDVEAEPEVVVRLVGAGATHQRLKQAFARRLNELVSSMGKILQRLLGEDIELATVSGALRSRVRADRGSNEQVLVNRVVNARDAMPAGGKLTIETANIDLDADFATARHGAKMGMHVMLSVTDTGSGMDKQTLARVLEPFFTTKEHGKGTGLGLSTVFGIVEQSGGTVRVYSEPRLEPASARPCFQLGTATK